VLPPSNLWPFDLATTPPRVQRQPIPAPPLGDLLNGPRMDRIRRHVPPLRPHVPTPITPLPMNRSRPFDWRSNRIPPPELQGTFRPDRPGQPGWGLEVTRSRPF
jgi:hypothetical protein